MKVRRSLFSILIAFSSYLGADTQTTEANQQNLSSQDQNDQRQSTTIRIFNHQGAQGEDCQVGANRVFSCLAASWLFAYCGYLRSCLNHK